MWHTNCQKHPSPNENESMSLIQFNEFSHACAFCKLVARRWDSSAGANPALRESYPRTFGLNSDMQALPIWADLFWSWHSALRLKELMLLPWCAPAAHVSKFNHAFMKSRVTTALAVPVKVFGINRPIRRSP